MQHVHVMNTCNFNIDANDSMDIHECNNGGIYTLNVIYTRGMHSIVGRA